MATNSNNTNTFMREKENQQRTYDVIKNLITNILTGVVSSLTSAGMAPEMVLSMIDSLTVETGKIESLKTTLTRKKMKVPIFGPTSSGKSMVINAMLGKELLPCGMGHTTNCFIQIEEARGDDVLHDGVHFSGYSEVGSHFIIRRSRFDPKPTTDGTMSYTENVKNPLDISRLHDLADATAEQPLDISRHIEIFLAKEDHKCNLLSHFVQILDCPGDSTCREIGDKVKSFCGDADVHVLIVSTSSGISAEDKEHFLKVKERLPNPDIIIGFTQWDLAANERPERKEKVKQQHLREAFEVLKSTDTVSKMEEVMERCFFISGSEALGDALGEQMKHVKGQQERLQSFRDFMKIEERASAVAKKARLDTDRKACREILVSCMEIIDTLRAWIRNKTTELEHEIWSLEQNNSRLRVQIKKYQKESKEQREKALTSADEEVMACTDDVVRRMETKLASERNERALDAYFQEHVATIVHDWYRKIVKATNRTTRMACEDYSLDLLREYKKCFQEFPHEHPKAFIQALHEEILPQMNTREMKASTVDSLLKGVTDRGLVAMFATTRRRVVNEGPRGQADRQRMAAGASIMFLRVRRWLWEAIEDKLLRKFEMENRHGLNDIKKSCRQAVEAFCDITDAYYHNQIDNALRLQFRSELIERRTKINNLFQLSELLNDYRREAEEIGWQQANYIIVTE